MRARTLRCSFVLPSFAGGGAERVALQLAGALAEAPSAPGMPDFSVQLVVLSPYGPLAHSVSDLVAVAELGRPRLRQALPAIFRHLWRTKPDILFSTFAHVTPGLAALRPLLPRRPMLVAREANLPSLSLGRSGTDRWVRVGCRLAYPRCDLVLASSARMATELRADFAVSAKTLRVLPNPIDESRLRKLAASEPVARQAGRLFVASGRMVAQKGFDRLIESWPTLPADCSLVLLGEGADRAGLEGLTARLGLAERVRFLGYVDNPWRWYARADAVLIPSRFEGMPNVALEALACGTPVIGTPETGGLVELASLAECRPKVRIAPSGAEFRKAILATPQRTGPMPAQSALPAAYRLTDVSARLRRMLAALNDPQR